MQNTILKMSLLILLALLSFKLSANSDSSAKIAVAANFIKTIEAVAKEFTKQTGNEVKFSFGPTGKLYAQIYNGAPFDAFFAADEKRPLKAIEQGLAVKNSYFIYAQGQLAFYSHHALNQNNPLLVLKANQYRHLAIANPKTAPYGEAAAQVLKQAGLYASVRPKLVFGESIGNAFQFVATGNAELGFLAYSQIKDPQSPLYQKGDYWLIPQTQYNPINQGAVLLKRGAKNPVAVAFMQFMQSPKAKQIMQAYGYK